VGHETLRKFVEGITDKPHPATRRKYARLYHEYGRGITVRDLGARAANAGMLAELKSLLSPGETAASADIKAIFDAAGESGRDLPASAGQLRKLLLRWISDAYQGGTLYKTRRKPKK
jgi:hypothetical protein